MKIIVCDDEKCVLENLSFILNRYFTDKNINIGIELFSSADDLLYKYENAISCDILLLDVQMQGTSGIAAAKEIRKRNKRVKIVFLTSSPDYALDSYSVNASGYIIKPITEFRLFSFLDWLLSEMESEKEKFLNIKTNEGLSRILISKIEYCEIYNKTIYFHMSDKTIIKSVGSMNQLANDLYNFREFYKAHRSYIINLSFINTVTTDMVTMQSGGKVPIPYRKASELKTAALSYFDESVSSKKEMF